VLVVVRPEAILIDPPPALANRVQATVAEIAFAGPATQVLLRAGGTVLRARLPSRVGGPAFAAGDTVTIGWNADEGHLVAA
jgi:ABC-type Fe3+/spermidine/putrescine transport system ATPase subunit